MSPLAAAMVACVVAGVASTLQATFASILGRRVGVLQATTVAALTGGVIVAIGALVSGRGAGGIVAVFREPVWLWLLAGLFGATVVTTLTFAPPRIGVFATFALLIGGQLVASVLIDALGLFGVERVPVTVARLMGILLLVAGGALVLRR
jgi:transporter family-2 protein